jgi:hypothetical protein
MESTARRTGQPFSISAYFETDVLTPFEYSTTFRRRDHLLPELKLMFAVLTDAIECFQKYISARSRRSRTLFNDAEAWILSRDICGPFSFEQICEALHISPNYLRIGLMRWRAEHQAPEYPQKRIRESLRYRYRLRNPRITA